MQINKYYKTISGGFTQINDEKVNLEMHSRFNRANKISPFVKSKFQENLVVIHYRLGDRRAVGQHHRDFNSDLIIEPGSFAFVLSKFELLNLDTIYVVSDEPKLAQKLLARVGVIAKINSNNGNIWEDILFMSKANFFIGSNSQVSQLVNIFVENNGGKSYMLNYSKKNECEKFVNTTYLDSCFLDINDEVYSLDFKLEEGAHSAYQSKLKLN
jgi:hypothetical protein